ncbi:hypothetical protein ERO13_D03G144800v2 [Gossypium hirsutum]|uniref:non-specific serine/threonine protein kinase n=6 Tax=Gossypium TaxID=3633 RepID=A0A1U8LG87_GOSHI|nr:CBL-interacting serine/threonine-protein kinase 10 [Gossypium hirsutum]KAB2038797.1 hypothetical protein ES319_D03G168600v1 [Gossypium barbadense]KAG4155983.1 hypothetical protein ERO13_D03G144800v2 [Gossypium hirsutum]TYG77259.1 hypothetical protein ES288_D03G180400v1 [Gossypium darwinii]TYI91024.1 hypothetical protein E1A91_D03G162900v1 [Gossypium mustelinum]
MENKPSVLTQRYEIGRLLGQGTFAKVYYARCIQNNMSVAIKVIDKDKVMRVGMINQIKREISVMRIARHPNIVQLYEVMATKSKIFFIMEYCKGGELFNKVANGRLKVDVARKYFIQLINAVDFCHSRGVFHRDIKPENILLDENENLKVSDFGLSALAESKRQDGLLHTTCGTPAYVAPEVINRKGYDGVAADVWSCGVVLYVLLAGYLPFHDSNLMELYRKIGKAEFRFPSWFPLEARRLVCKMLDPNPTSRISMSKIRGSAWFKKGLNVEQKKLEKENEQASPNMGPSAPCGNSNDSAETKQESVQLPSLNAFDLICGFDLSGLFDGVSEKRETRFSSRQPASVIISKLEEAARHLRLKVKKKDAGVLKMERLKEGRKGILSIDAEIFEVTQTFHLVEIKKSNGDTLEYQQILKEEMRPALQDIVWVWQGDQQQQELQYEEQQQLQYEEQQQLHQQQNESSSTSSSSFDKYSN